MKKIASVDYSGFSILELSELISAFEKTFGVVGGGYQPSKLSQIRGWGC